MSKKEKDRFDICELFMVKADRSRYFTGFIKRLKDDDGNLLVFSKIVMPDGFLWAQASDQKSLGKNLDKLCVMVLDNGLHKDAGMTTKILGTDFFLN